MYMKNIKYYLLSLTLTGCLVGCESLLDEEPLYSQNSAIVFSSENNAEMALLGCYGYMAAPNGYGQMWQEVMIGGSGLSYAQRNGADQDVLVRLNVPVSNSLVSLAWQGMYKVVAEVNAFIESMEGSTLSDDVKKQFLGEAYFLRALAYYNLATVWGDVPLKTVASSSDGIAVERSPKEEVYAQVVADFQLAADNMAPESEDGRANAWAAKAYLGKVYHKMARLGIDATANLENAKKVFDEVYASGVYALEPKFGDLFVNNVRGSEESIFQLNYTTESTSVFNRACNRLSPTHSTTGITWSTYRAARYGYDLMQGTYPDDPRIAISYQTSWRARGGNNQANPKAQVGDELCANDSAYLYPYFTYTIPDDFVMKNGEPTTTLKQYVARLPYASLSNVKNPSISEVEAYASTNGSSPENDAIAGIIKKQFVKAGGQNNWPSYMKVYDQLQVGTRSHKNLIVYRYAELLLLMADVYNELGDTQKAISLANEVLRRARNSGEGTSVEPQDWSMALSKNEVEEKLYFERLFEFIGEPNMFEMVRICGTGYMKKLLEYHNNHEITIASSELYASTKNAWLDGLFNDGNLSEDFLKKNLLFPIPQSEIDANSSITNADNNFGY